MLLTSYNNILYKTIFNKNISIKFIKSGFCFHYTW